MRQPTYTTNLPPQVRFCHKLPANAKLLYGEIRALCDQQGYCWASNHYFASLYHVEKKAVSRWIQQLEAQDYIRVEAGKTKGNQRRIYLTDDTSKRDEVSSQKGIAHPISEGGYPPKKTGEADALLINNFIDNNDRVDRVPTPEGKDISRNRGEAAEAEKTFQNNIASGYPHPPAVHRGRGDVPVSPGASSWKRLPPKGESSEFSKPSVAEVETYLQDQKELCPDALTARAQALRFINYYESNGWRVGRNAMQDWRAAANNWLLNTQTYSSSKTTHHENQRNHLSSGQGKDYTVPL